MSDRELILRVAARYLIARDFFEIGDPILFGKYKNKKGVIVGWGKDHKGNPTVFIDPIPKGRKKTKEMGLFKFWHNPPPLIKKQEEAAAQEALGIKVGCIIAGRKFDDDLCLFKNRDRAYDSEVDIVHLEHEGTEMAFILDPKSGYIEGVNEHGIGIVNTALMVAHDEAEGKTAGKGPIKSKDGPKIYKALAAKTLKEAVNILITENGGIKGHTFVADGKELLCIECSRSHPARITKLDMDRVNTRTNHGISYPDAGYTKGDDYVSSIVRRWEAQKRIQDVKHPEDIGPALMDPIHKKESPFNPVRDTDKMRTTSQLLINTTRPRMILYLIPGHGTLRSVRNALPNKRKPKIPVRVIQYEGAKDTVSEKDAALIKRVAARYKSKKQVKKQDGGDMTIYEYSDRQIADRNREKAKRIEGLRKSVDKLRTQVKKDLKSSDEKTNAVALAVALMDHTFERVGNEGSAKEGHFGVTTWNVSHVKFSGGKATIKYVGKSGVDQKKTVTDAALVKALKASCKDKSKNACVVDASASDVNSYLKPFDISAKDIRGFHANTEMKAQLKKVRSGTIPSDKKEKAAKLKEEFKKALEATAKAVGHEPSTLKSQYLVPGLEDDYMKDGSINESHTKKGGRDRKDESQREDEQADKMIRKAPKLKPPRYDLRNNRTLKERDEDMEGLDKQDGGDEDLQKDVRRQARRVAFKWLALPREPSAQRMLMRMAAAKPDAATSQKGKAHRSNDPKNPGWIGMSPTGAPHFFPDGEFAEDKAKAYAKGEKFEEPKKGKKPKKEKEPAGEAKPGAEEDVPTGEPTDEEVADGEVEGEGPPEPTSVKKPPPPPEKTIPTEEEVQKQKGDIEEQKKVIDEINSELADEPDEEGLQAELKEEQEHLDDLSSDLELMEERLVEAEEEGEEAEEEGEETKPDAKKLSPEEKTKVKTLDARKKKTEKAIKDLKAKAQAAEGDEAKTLDKELKGKQKDLERHERQIAKIKGEDPPETEKDRTTRFEGEVDAKRQAREEVEKEILGSQYIQYSSAQMGAYLDDAFPYGDSWEELDGLTRRGINKARQKVKKFREKLKDNEQWIEANDNLASARDDLSENSEEPTGTTSEAPGKTRAEQRETQHTDLKEELKALKKKKKSGKGEDGSPLLADEITELDAEIERKSTKVKEVAKQVAKEKKERDKAESQVARERRQKGVGEATKITTELIGPGSTLSDEVQKALTKVLGEMSDLEASIFAEEFKKSLGETLKGKGDSPEAATLANEAVQRAVGDIKDPKELAKAAAEIAYARNVVANPKILGGVPVSDAPKTSEQMAARITEAVTHYKELDHSLRVGAAETIAEELKDLDPKSNLAKELNGILTGIATAAVLKAELSGDGKQFKSDPTVPGAPQFSVKAGKLLQAMDRQGGGNLETMFMPMKEGMTSPAGRAALRDGLAAMNDADVIDQLTDGDEDHPLHPLAELINDPEIDEEIRKVLREALVGMSIDSMTWGDAAIAEISKENDPNKRQSMFDKDTKEKRAAVSELVDAAKSGETGKFVSTNSEDDGSGVSNDEGVSLLDVMRAQQVSDLLDEHSEGADAVPGAPSAAILREYANSKDPSVLETEVSPTPEEFRSAPSGKKSGSKSQFSVYRTTQLGEGPSLDSVQSPAPTNRRQTSMPKITETGARQVTANLDRLATLFQSDFATLGLPRDVASDMALRCDMLSDRIESHAGLRPRQAQMDPPANYTEEKVAPNEFDPAEIGEESSQAFLRNEDEPYMDAFTQDENDQLRQVQQDGMFSNAKAASELIRKLQARLAAGASAQKKTELNDELSRLAASFEDYAALDSKVAEFREAASLGAWTDYQAEEHIRQLTELERELSDAEAEIEALAGEVLKRKTNLEAEHKKKIELLKKELPKTIAGQKKAVIECRQALIRYAKVAEKKRPGVKQMLGDPTRDIGAPVRDRGGELLQRIEAALGDTIAAQVAEIYDTVMEEITVLRPTVRGLEYELKEKNASGNKTASEEEMQKEAGVMQLLVKFRDWLARGYDKMKRVFGMGTRRIDNAAKKIDVAIATAEKGWDMALKNASDKSAGEVPEAFIQKMKDKAKDKDGDEKDDDKDSGKPWEKDKKASHGFDLTA